MNEYREENGNIYVKELLPNGGFVEHVVAKHDIIFDSSDPLKSNTDIVIAIKYNVIDLDKLSKTYGMYKLDTSFNDNLALKIEVDSQVLVNTTLSIVNGEASITLNTSNLGIHTITLDNYRYEVNVYES